MTGNANRRRPLILAGAGHAHLVALKIWLDNGNRPDGKIILINSTAQAWYSGMMPGLLAGYYSKQQCAIELQPLCAQINIELVIDMVEAVDANNRQLQTRQASFAYQLLSINTGGQPPAPDTAEASIVIAPVKPFTGFIQAWQRWQADAAIEKIAVIGGGPAAFEVSLALRQSLPASNIGVFCQKLLEQQPAGAALKARKALQNADITLNENCSISAVKKDCLISEGQSVCQADAVVLATGAAPLSWYQSSGLTTDAAGFIRINNHLQSLSHPDVFVTGDAASLPGAAHSGVYAVRQGPVLAENLNSQINKQPLAQYQPQKNALALMAISPKKALMHYSDFSAQGQLMGYWKKYLDQRFVRQYPQK